jgi:hypothetical protein
MTAEVLPWTGIAALLSCFMSLHFGLAFQIASRTKGMFFAVTPAVALNIVANILLLPVFGVVAAGWSTVAGYSIALLLTIRFGNRHLRVPLSFYAHLAAMVVDRQRCREDGTSCRRGAALRRNRCGSAVQSGSQSGARGQNIISSG